MKIKISKNKQKQLTDEVLNSFPKYTTFIINQASQTSQATRPQIVGQLSEEFPNYLKKCKNESVQPSLQGWVDYHSDKFLDAVENSKTKIKTMVNNFKDAIELIDDELIEEWIKDLLFSKTYYGFNLEAIIIKFFQSKGCNVRKATAEEESRNIDLFVNERPYQVKPISFKRTNPTTANLGIQSIIYYSKIKDTIELEIDDPKLLDLIN